ncbi:MAG: glycosyltransferase family 4 protein [Thermoplasmata archaeon]|nr:glycosyltransferase family 4 protein [Thermoplasmata archaeon]
MKVIMLTYSTKARGGVAHALKLSEHLQRDGADVVIHSLCRDDDPESKKFYRDTEVPHIVHEYRWDDEVMTRLNRMIEAYEKGIPTDASVYHAQDCVGGTALSRLKKRGVLSAPVFRTVHHIDDFAEPRLFEFERAAVSHADHLFVVSEYWRNELKRDYGLDSVVAYNGIDLEDFGSVPERRTAQPTILFVGGLESRKGLEYLILALPHVLKAAPDARLRIVAKAGFRGVDNAEWFELLAERAGVRDGIDFYESVGQQELMQFYSDADVVVLPSRNEGWGLSLMEAMAFEKPVVATRVGGIPELVRDGVDGILVDPGDLRALSEAITSLLSDSGLRTRMGLSGRERVTQYRWETTARLTMRQYECILNQTDHIRS